MRPQATFLPVKSEAGAHTLALYDWGDSHARHVIVCVHGLTRNAADFDVFASHMAARGSRVIALSMAGRGESAWLTDPMQYSYATYVADCLSVLDNFHLRHIDWVGTSMGGIIGMMIAAYHPKRIRKLVLNDVGSFLSKEALTRIYSYVASLPEAFASMEDAEAYMRKNFAPWALEGTPYWESFIASSLEPIKDGHVRLRCDPQIIAPMRRDSKEFTEVQDVNLADIWARIKHPTLILRGADSDILLPHTVEAMKSTNLRAQSTIIEGVGHCPSLMKPEEITVIERFLMQRDTIPMVAGM